MLSPLILALSAQTAAPELFLLGKPVLGGRISAEVTAEPGSIAFLGLDTLPGSITLGTGTLGLGLSSGFKLFTLGAGGPTALRLTGDLPSDPSKLGAPLYLQAASVDALGTISLSQTDAITLGAPLPVDQADDWCYQLQGPGGSNLSLAPIAASAYDLSVTDFSSDGTSEFTPAEVASLKGSGDPDRIRLAYMSIGEAEDYRFYWNDISPSLVAASNPAWPGNFKVFYWEPEWKEVVVTGNAAIGKSYLDRIIDQGFDGVYLDIIDAFEFFGPAEAGGQNARRDAAQEMIQFVAEIAHHARVTRGMSDFLVFPQNGSNLLEDEWFPADSLEPGDPASPAAMAALQRERFLLTIDGFGIEDVFFTGGADENNPLNPDNYLLGILAGWRASGVPIFSVEYITQTPKIDAFYATVAPAEGFVPHATVRDLDLLTVNPGHAPD